MSTKKISKPLKSYVQRMEKEADELNSLLSSVSTDLTGMQDSNWEWKDADTMASYNSKLQDVSQRLDNYRKYVELYGNSLYGSEGAKTLHEGIVSNINSIKDASDVTNYYTSLFSNGTNKETYDLWKNKYDKDMEKLSAFEKLREAEDFAEKSKYDKNANIYTLFSDQAKLSTKNNENLLDYISDIKDNALGNSRLWNMNKLSDESENKSELLRFGSENTGLLANSKYKNVTADELAMYNYLANTQGYEAAEDYYKLIEDSINYREGQKIANSWKGLPVIRIGTSLASGFDSTLQGAANFANSVGSWLTGKEHEDRATSVYGYAGGLITEKAKSDNYISGIATQVASSIGQQIPAMLANMALGGALTPTVASGAISSVAASKIASGVSQALYYSSIYGNSYNDALKKGLSGGKATGYGIASATLEALTEAMSPFDLVTKGMKGTLNKLGVKLDKLIYEMADSSFAKFAQSALGEGLEEVVSSLIEPYINSAFLGEDKEWNLEEIWDSFVVGALSGVAMNAPSIVGSSIQNRKLSNAIDSGISEADINDVINSALTMNKDSASYKKAKDLADMGDVNTFDSKQLSKYESKKKSLINSFTREAGEIYSSEIDSQEKAFRKANKKGTEFTADVSKLGDVAKAYYNMNTKASADTTAKRQKEKNISTTEADIKKSASDVNIYNTTSDNTITSNDGSNVDFSAFKNGASVQNGNVVFTSSSGETISTKDVSAFPTSVAMAVTVVEDGMIPKEAVKAFFANLPDGIETSSDLAKYVTDFNNLYGYGKSNAGVNVSVRSDTMSDLDEKAKFSIYEAGIESRKSAEAEFADKVSEAKKSISEDKLTSNKGTVNKDGIKTKSLTATQRSAILVAKVFSEFGINVEFYESTKEEKNALKNPNGWFDSKTGTLHIDINAGYDPNLSGEGVLWAMSHEITHLLKTTASKEFSVLTEYVIDTLYDGDSDSFDTDVNDRMDRYEKNHPGETMSSETAVEEIVARACENMLFRSDALSEMLAKCEEKHKGFAKTVYDAFKNLAERFKTFFKSLTGQFDSKTAEARFFYSNAEKMQKLSELWKDAFEKGMNNARYVYGMSESDFANGKVGVATNVKDEPVAESSSDGSVKLSMRTYEDSGRDLYEKFLDKQVKKKILSKEDAKDMLSGLDDIYKVCKEFKDKYAPFSKWSEAEVITDTYGKPVFSVVTPNGEYKMNLDFSLVCRKRRTLDAVFNEMAKSGIIDDFELGNKSIVKINELIRKNGFETSCDLCFVDAKRYRQADVADSFVSLYNELVRSLVPEGTDISYFNFSENSGKNGGEDISKRSDLDFTHINEVLKKYESGTVAYKAAKYIKSDPEARKLLTRGDFMSSGGFDAVKSQNETILSLYNSKKGSGGPKAAFGDTQYLNEIIKRYQWTPKKAYEVGGVRVQSFSDYVPRLVFDYTQMVYDLAAKQLPAHAYTKESIFAMQFGLSGIKINLSLIPAVVEDGIAPGLDANGNYVFAGESFDYELAKRIQNAEGYSENCGTICVGISDEHIRKLLDDPDIRMVIPYHKSGLNPIVAHMNKISSFKNYTNFQNTRDSDGTKLEKDTFNFNKRLHDLGEKGDPRAVAQEYLNYCDKNGYIPKFDAFRDHPNYYKLLADFALYDQNGNYIPQKGVTATFPTESSEFGSMKSLIESALEEDAVIEGRRDSTISKIVNEIVETIPKKEIDIPETTVEKATGDVESWSKKYSDRDNIDNDREILRKAFRDSTIADKYKSSVEVMEGLKRYKSILETYDSTVEQINRYSANVAKAEGDLQKLLRKKNVASKEVRDLRNVISKNNRVINEVLANKLAKADAKLMTLESTTLRKVVDEALTTNYRAGAKAEKVRAQEAKLKRAEKAEKAMTVARINTYAKSLMKYLNQKDVKKRMPDVFANGVTEFLQAFDYAKISQKTGEATKSSLKMNEKVSAFGEVNSKTFAEMSKGFKELVEKYTSSKAEAEYFSLPDEVVDVLEEGSSALGSLAEKYEGINLYEADIKTLNDIKKAFSVVNALARNSTKLFSSSRSAESVARADVKAFEKLKPVKNQNSKAREWMYNLADPRVVFTQMGEAGNRMFSELKMGEDRQSRLVQDFLNFTEENFKKEDMQKWGQNKKEFELEVRERGEGIQTKSVTLTDTQIMSLYCLSKDPDGMRHIVPTETENEDGTTQKSASGVKILTNTDSGKVVSDLIIFDKDSLNEVISSLTEEQKNAADKIQKYMATTLADYGNLVSYRRFGIAQFTNSKYFPIKTINKDATNATTKSEGSITAILNKSFTKSRIDGAKNAVLVEDIFDVYSNHSGEMIQYASWALPLEDFVKWFNCTWTDEYNGQKVETTMQNVIRETFGSEMNKYIHDLLLEINSPISSSGGDPFQKVMIRNIKTALVGGKIKQVFLQPTAILRALNDISSSSMAKALAASADMSSLKKNYDEAAQYSTAARMKKLGYRETGLSHSLNDMMRGANDVDFALALGNDTFKGKAKETLKSLQQASLKPMEWGDMKGFSTLWRASKYEALKNDPKLKEGSQEHLIAAGKIMDKACYDSQVFDSVLTRAPALKPGSFNYLSSAFMSEKLKSTQCLLNTLLSINSDIKSGMSKAQAWKKHYKELVNDTYAYVLSGAVSAAVSSVFSGLNDDDKDWYKPTEFLPNLASSVIEELSPLSKIPFVNDAISILRGYSSSRLDLTGIEAVADLSDAIIRLLNGKNNLTAYGWIQQCLEVLSLTLGVGVQNLTNDIVQLINLFLKEEISEKK